MDQWMGESFTKGQLDTAELWQADRTLCVVEERSKMVNNTGELEKSFRIKGESKFRKGRGCFCRNP